MDDLISRKALLEKFKSLSLGEHSLIERIFADGVYTVIEAAPAVEAEPVRHGECHGCKIKETGHGLIEMCGNGWQVCIGQRGEWFSLVVNHCGDQIEAPIEFCPWCGAKLDGGKEE